jgi:hypothetical protein
LPHLPHFGAKPDCFEPEKRLSLQLDEIGCGWSAGNEETMNAHALFASMSPTLAAEILEYTFSNDKALYRATLDSVAQVRKVRSVFMERQPRAERHATMAAYLARPSLEMTADGLLRNWLVKSHTQLLSDFLDSLKIKHEKGVVEELPPNVDDAALKEAVEALLTKYSSEIVTIYLHAFHQMNETRWPNLESLLHQDPRLQLKRETE